MIRHRESYILSLIVGVLSASILWLASKGVISPSVYPIMASVSATLLGFVFTAEQLAIMILANENSTVAKILRKHNPGYINELLGLADLTMVSLFSTAIVSGAASIFAFYPKFIAYTTMFLVGVSMMSLLILILNVQKLYHDHFNVDLSSNNR